MIEQLVGVLLLSERGLQQGQDLRKPELLGEIARDGFRCRCCGIPVIGADVRKLANRLYPDAVPWGRCPSEQHAAFQCMWLQFDHVVPHSHGGRSSLDNIVVTCALCNYGKDRYTLAQLGLSDPRTRAPEPCSWDGLQRLLWARPLSRKARTPALEPTVVCRAAASPASEPPMRQLRSHPGLVDVFVPGAWISKGYLYTPTIDGKSRWFPLSPLAIAEEQVRDGVDGCRICCAADVFARRGINPSIWLAAEI